MRQGDPFQICQEADGHYCSGTLKPNATQYIDHLYYFNIDLPGWGHAGCPMNISAFAQPWIILFLNFNPMNPSTLLKAEAWSDFFGKFTVAGFGINI